MVGSQTLAQYDKKKGEQIALSTMFWTLKGSTPDPLYL